MTDRAFRLVRLAARRAIDEEVDAEVAFHLEMRAAELVARGLTPDAARAEALRRFGDTHHWSRRDDAQSIGSASRTRRPRRSGWQTSRRTCATACARLLRTPLFSLLAVVTLALGIGANAAVFGVVKSVLLDALPYADADRLVRVYARFRDGSSDRGAMSAGADRPTSPSGSGRSRRSRRSTASAREAILERRRRAARREDRLGAAGALPRRSACASRWAARCATTTRRGHRAFNDARHARRRGSGCSPATRAIGRARRCASTASRAPSSACCRAASSGPMGDADFYFPLSLCAVRCATRSTRAAALSYGVVARLKPGVDARRPRSRELAAIGADARARAPARQRQHHV